MYEDEEEHDDDEGLYSYQLFPSAVTGENQ